MIARIMAAGTMTGGAVPGQAHVPHPASPGLS